jgi:UDP-glucose 4-epimerase
MNDTSKKLILVTGGAGFIGSHLCERLVADGHKVISLDNYFTGSRENHVPGVDYREGHTKDIEQLVPESPDLVYHLGEYSRVERSLQEPALVWDLNINGTFAVLEFCRAKNIKIVYAGSSTKFADGGLGRDQSPYAFTKATNTELVRNYGNWYSLPYAVTYFYNVYGPGERAGSYGTVIEIFKQKRLKGEPLSVTAPGTQRRNFTHVDDIIEGLVLVGERGKGDEYGIGSETSYSIREVAEMFGGEIIMMPEVKGNRMDSVIDISKTQLLGWEPKKSLIDYVAGIQDDLNLA